MFSGTKVTYAIIFSCMFQICFGFLESGFIVCWKRKKTLWFAWIMWLSLCVCVCIYIYIYFSTCVAIFVQGFRCRVLPSGWTCLQNYFSLGKVHAEMNKPTVGKVQNVCYCVCVCVLYVQLSPVTTTTHFQNRNNNFYSVSLHFYSYTFTLHMHMMIQHYIVYYNATPVLTITHLHSTCIGWYNSSCN